MSKPYHCHDCHKKIPEDFEVRVPIEEYEGTETPHPREMVDSAGYEWKVTQIILCHECGAEYEEVK